MGCLADGETFKNPNAYKKDLGRIFFFFFPEDMSRFFSCILAKFCAWLAEHVRAAQFMLAAVYPCRVSFAPYGLVWHNCSFTQHTDHTTITTAVHMSKYMKDQKKITSGLHSPILWKLSLPNTHSHKGICISDRLHHKTCHVN